MGQPFQLGSDYYPEHFATENVSKDALLMKAGGLNIVRIGDFAWFKMQPDSKIYTLDWLIKTVDTLGKYQIKSLLCTSTAAIPKWMFDQYPDIMQVTETGQRKPFGRLLNKDIESLAGIQMQEQFALIKQENTKINYPNNPSNTAYTGSLWYDDFKPLATEVLATYNSRFLKGKPAVVKNKVGKGTVYYIGTIPSDEMINQLATDFISNAHIVPLAKCANKLVDITELKGTNKYVYAINFSQEDHKIQLSVPMRDIFTNQKEESTIVKVSDFKVLEVE